jgi:glycosyltransferase involved in cell wall biosynthesis
MYIVCHPTGNANVRAVLQALDAHCLLEAFYTTLAVRRDDWPLRLLPSGLRQQVGRRAYDLRHGAVIRFPQREAVRLAAAKLRLGGLTRHETGWACIDAVCAHLDRRVAAALAARPVRQALSGVYCYEDCALQTFQAAKKQGLRCVYDLPIAYWQTARRLLEEEAERWPEWKPTLVGTRNSAAKLDRKTAELELADVVITPSRFVYGSLPEAARQRKACHIAEFGSPVPPGATPIEKIDRERPLRVLFVGSMTQRKGLADLFAALKLLKRPDVELIVLGSPVCAMEFYRRQYADFRYEAPRPHAEVLRLMQECDVFVLPSIVEGRALVQQEALACGLPLIVTPNAGGEDLIREGETGFLVPIRSPESLAEKIGWFADHRDLLPDMRSHAVRKAVGYTWERYGSIIVNIVGERVANARPA